MPRGQPAVATAMIPDRVRLGRVPPCRVASVNRNKQAKYTRPIRVRVVLLRRSSPESDPLGYSGRASGWPSSPLGRAPARRSGYGVSEGVGEDVGGPTGQLGAVVSPDALAP
jgi:hypothetical protein